jgi:hypothetical protein
MAEEFCASPPPFPIPPMGGLDELENLDGAVPPLRGWPEGSRDLTIIRAAPPTVTTSLAQHGHATLEEQPDEYDFAL